LPSTVTLLTKIDNVLTKTGFNLPIYKFCVVVVNLCSVDTLWRIAKK